MLQLPLPCLLPLVVQVEVENDVETDARKDECTKRFKMGTILHEQLVIVVIDYTPAELAWGEEGQELGVVLKSIVGTVRVFLARWIFLLLVFGRLVEMRLWAESRAKLIGINSARFLRCLLLILSGCVLIEVLLVSVLQKLIVLSLIIRGELRPLPLFEVFSCPIIILIHVLLGIILPLLFFLLSFSGFSLPVHIIEIFLSESVTWGLSFQARIGILKHLEFLLNKYDMLFSA